MTTPDQLRQLILYLQDRVAWSPGGDRVIVFEPPGVEAMAADGIDEATARAVTGSPWWPELVDDVIETPDFAGPDESRDTVLGYARDVVSEAIRKRMTIDP